MTCVGIHQPNYAPWLGYFAKIAQSDVFIFLDDVQYSKNNYINRVQVLCDGAAKWLTIPVRVPLGTTIRAVSPTDAEWAEEHMNFLSSYYRRAPAREEVMSELRAIYCDAGQASNLAGTNVSIIRSIASRLGIMRKFLYSSELACSQHKSDDRLVCLVKAIDPHGTYLSGQGASFYQDSKKFADAFLGISFTKFKHPAYPQGGEKFVPGLSILDSIFWLGWDKTAAILKESVSA